MHSTHAARLLLGGTLLFLAPGVGADPAAPTDRGVEVLALRGAPRRGTFEALTPTALSLKAAGAASATEIPLSELRELRAAPVPPARAQDRLRVILVNGDVLLAESHAPAPDGLEVRSPSFGTLLLPLDVLRSLEPLTARAGPCADEAGKLKRKPGADRAALLSGDEVSGTLLEVKVEGLRIELERGRERLVTWSELKVAHVDNPLAPTPAGAYTEVETHAGDLLRTLTAPAGDVATGLSVALASDSALVARVPLAAVRALRWRGVACVDATSLPFTSTFGPLASGAYPPGSFGAQNMEGRRGARVGRRPNGCPLTLDGSLYTHGFAVHGGSAVTLPLDGAFATFETLVGIDDDAKEAGKAAEPPVDVPGDVDVRVLGDGKVLWEAKRVTGLKTAQRVGPLDVRGVKVLVLEVEYGEDEDVLDRATWADPVLLR